MHIIRIFIISRIHWKRKLWYQLWRISLIRRECWRILLFFSRELFMGFLAKDSLIGILFSGSRSKCLVQKIEAALKELVFGAYPQYRDDKDINIMLTYILYGCYYAFYENRKYGDVPVLSSITELTGKTAQAALNMIKN
mgnify:CR=1 FL=1